MYCFMSTVFNSFLLSTYEISIHNNEKLWSIERINKMWQRETKWANAVEKMTPTDLCFTGFSQFFNLLKTQYLQSTIEWKYFMNTRLYFLSKWSTGIAHSLQCACHTLENNDAIKYLQIKKEFYLLNY